MIETVQIRFDNKMKTSKKDIENEVRRARKNIEDRD